MVSKCQLDSFKNYFLQIFFPTKIVERHNKSLSKKCKTMYIRIELKNINIQNQFILIIIVVVL